MNKPIYIGIADDHLVLRQGLISLLKEYEELKIIVDVNNGKELMDALKNTKPDIILLDIEMPVMNGREALEKIKIKYPKIKVIIMSMHFNDAYIIEFIKNGACAFLAKNCDIDKIVDALHSVYQNGFYYDNKVSTAMAALIKKNPVSENENSLFSLSKRELEIIKMICKRKSNNDIANELFISRRTVEGHRYHISKKTNTNNTIDLIDFASKNNLFNSNDLF